MRCVRAQPAGPPARGAGGDCDHGNRVTRHIEELGRVPFFGSVGRDVTLDNCTDVTAAQPAFGDVARHDHVTVQFERAFLARQCAICHLQNLKEGREFESHSLRQRFKTI